jgi:hypothetical protein
LGLVFVVLLAWQILVLRNQGVQNLRVRQTRHLVLM